MMIRRTALIGFAFLAVALTTACNDAAPTGPAGAAGALARPGDAALSNFAPVDPPEEQPMCWNPAVGWHVCDTNLWVTCVQGRLNPNCPGWGGAVFDGRDPVHGKLTIRHHRRTPNQVQRIEAIEVRIGQLDRALALILRERQPFGAIIRAEGAGAPSVQVHHNQYLVARSVDPASGTIRYTVMQGPQP